MSLRNPAGKYRVVVINVNSQEVTVPAVQLGVFSLIQDTPAATAEFFDDAIVRNNFVPGVARA